jgi:hypothetical protein
MAILTPAFDSVGATLRKSHIIYIVAQSGLVQLSILIFSIGRVALHQDQNTVDL